MTEHKRFGRYETERVLGRGGMGTVYLARDPLIGRAVAIKEIRLDGGFEGEGGFDAEQRREIEARFEQEFRAAGNLSHPNVVTIFDVGSGNGSHFIAMEYIEGKTLDERLQSGRRMATDQILDIGRQLASGLDYAHGQGVVHRDIKPANILFADRVCAKITDFGVAKLRSADLTQTGRLIGTPAFMAPEQILGQTVDGRADQFSLAVILYLLLTGSKPFAGEHKSTVLYQIVHEEPRPPALENSDLPPAVDAVLLRALAKSPNQRFVSCRELIDALRKALSAERRKPNRPPAMPPSPSPVAAVAIHDTATTVVSNSADDSHSPTSETVLTRVGKVSEVDATLELSAVNEPQVLADRSKASRQTAPRKKWWIAGLVLLTAAIVGYFWLAPSSRVPNLNESLGTGVAEPAGNQQASSAQASDSASSSVGLPVVSEVEGASIWRDGVDTGLTTPATVELEGPAGSSVLLEVKDEGRTLASRAFVLGEALPPAWNASPPRLRTLTILSRPAGARVDVDGEDSGQSTPAEVPFERGRRYRLDLQLDGYETTSWTFELDGLNPQQDQSGELNFPLRKLIPPAVVSIDADYAVSARAGKRRWPAAKKQRLELAPGKYRIELLAEQIFFRQTYEVTLGSDDREKLQVPEAFSVQIIATPANCQVSVDGQVVDFTPILDRRIAAGEHEFLFDWPTLGRSKRITVDISEPQQRIFMTAD